MLQDIVAAGTTSYTGARLRVIDSTNGTPETGFAYNTTGIDLWYQRPGATRTAITEVTRATVDAAFAEGGVIHVSDGYVRLDLPDAALAAGASFVDFGGTATGMIVIGGRIKLDPVAANVTQIAGAAVSTTTAQLGVNVVQLSADATAADNAEAFFDGTGYAGTNNVIPTVTTLTGHTAQTGDAYARLGAPAGASVSADVAAVKVDTAAILLDTAEIGAAGAGLTALGTAAELLKVPKSDSNVTWNATALGSINAEVDTALNTAIPGSPTANSINERIVTMDGSTLQTADVATLITTVGAAGAGLTAVQLVAAGVDAIFDEAVDGTTTFRQSIRIQNSAAAGELAGAATDTITITDLAASKTRLTATVDADGNRTHVAFTDIT